MSCHVSHVRCHMCLWAIYGGGGVVQLWIHLFRCGKYSTACRLLRLEYCAKYRAMYPNMVWQLNQVPYSGHGTASTDWALGTLIHNSGLLFTESLHQPRWLFATECLAAQGFPVVPGMFNFEGDLCKQPLCSFNLPSANRKIRAGCEQAGNSMHVMVMTVLQLHSLVALRYERLPDVIANVALAAKFNRDLKRKRDGVGMDPPRVRFRLRKKTKV